MTHRVTVDPIEFVPQSARVCHFDELSDRGKHDLSQLVSNGMRGTVESDTALELTQYDVITFTDYCRVAFVDSPVSNSISA